MTIRVLVVDDHPVFRSGLRNLVHDSDDLELVAEAADGDEAVVRCREHGPDVVLMDIRMPGTSGVEATRRIVAEWPRVGVLMLTMLEDDTSIFAALRAGARGYVLKGAAPDEIIRAIVAVAAGEALFGPVVAAKIATFLQPNTRTRSHPFPSLSSRERDILDLIAAGRSNPAIAEALALSEKTVRNNVSNIFAKLHATDRAEVIVKARRAGLGNT
ncbi:response regulator transcription factor [Dactylosporangium aurantiacum]|uniref:Response regulator transcription factor n=1 Tax=Dactylosporangium aurantiacum TaxID=35754 RepID=A0A9Q9IS44_9ACTN|nr:response regulator transcription factor [Dactylosporangium aurantiacum]MDG6110492.1 response regulator transcription factor [Dactylosporangium aurantiacum]UWZ58380.1 response regulator transcription factor [Dactylosporangium aurantiacum]